jgi:hypothetical protein
MISERNSISTNLGFAPTQEVINGFQCLDFWNGPEPGNIYEKRRQSSFFSFIGIEYSHDISEKIEIGLRMNN